MTLSCDLVIIYDNLSHLMCYEKCQKCIQGMNLIKMDFLTDNMQLTHSIAVQLNIEMQLEM